MNNSSKVIEVNNDELAATHPAIASFNRSFLVKSAGQHTYDLAVNVKRGILTADEVATGEHAVIHGIACAWNSNNHWSCDASVKLAYEVLTEANCHAEAKAMLAVAKQNGIDIG